MTFPASRGDSPTALVTGARGFIGSHLCARLQSAGYAVHGVTRRASASVSVSDASAITWWEADLTDPVAVRRVVAAVRPKHVFHLASAVTGGRALDVVLPTFQSNLASTVNLLVALAEHGGAERIVLAGSLEEPDDKDPQAVAGSPYAASKAAATIYGRFFHALYDLPVTFARIFMVYGPAQMDLVKLVPYSILALLRGEAPKISSGTRPVDWIFVEDIVDGLMTLATAPSAPGQAIDLGSGSLTTVREIVERLAAIVDSGVQPTFGAQPDRALERVRVADVQRSLQLVNWEPRVALDDGLRRTVDWYRANLARLIPN